MSLFDSLARYRGRSPRERPIVFMCLNPWHSVSMTGMLEVLSKYLQNKCVDLEKFMHKFPGTGLFRKSGIYTHFEGKEKKWSKME